MTAAILLLGLRLHGVIDQIDAGWASVEWEGQDFGFVPAALLPEGAGEGDCIVLRRRRRGDPITLPQSVAPAADPVVRGTLHHPRARRAHMRRDHEPDQ